MSTLTPRKAIPAGLGQAFSALRRERRERGFHNESLIVADLCATPEPGEPVPAWFGGVRRATEKQDLHEATDFFVALILKPGENRPAEINVPVNAKSSAFMAEKLAGSRHNQTREKHSKVPIIGFVVDPSLSRQERRSAFFKTFAADHRLSRWLHHKGYAVANDPLTRDQVVAGKVAQRAASAQRRVVDEVVARQRATLFRFMEQGLVTNRRSLLRSLKKLRRGTVARTEELALREQIAEGVSALENDPAVRERVRQLAARFGRVVRDAQLEVGKLSSALTTPEAEHAIGLIFRDARAAFCAEEPTLDSFRIQGKLLQAAKNAFGIWFRRALRAQREAAAIPA